VGEWEEKLNSILGNQEVMEQILSLANSLTGEALPETNNPHEEEKETVPAFSLTSQPDADLLRRGIALLRGSSSETGRSTELLLALKPFLKEDKQKKLDRALQMVKMARLLRLTMDTSGTEEAGNV